MFFIFLANNFSFMEGARLRGTASLFRDYKPEGASAAATVKDGDSTVTVTVGRRILCDLIHAGQDPTAFPDPTEVRLDRPLDSYMHYGWGPHQCLGQDASMTAMTAMFKVVFGLKGLQRAQGGGPGSSWYGESQGELKKVAGPFGLTLYMTPDQSSFSPFPTTMKIWWDAE